MSHCTYRWVGFDFKVVVTEMTFHAELVDGCGVVHANLGLLCIVPHSHPYVVATATTPDVVWHLKPASNMIMVTAQSNR